MEPIFINCIIILLRNILRRWTDDDVDLPLVISRKKNEPIKFKSDYTNILVTLPM